MPKLNKKIVVSVSAAALVAIGAGTAYAYWSTTGSGTGSGTAASSNGTLTLYASIADGITPGGTAAVTYTADNPGSSSLQVGTITPTVSIDSGHSGCLVSDFSIAPTTSNTTVPAHSTGFAVGSGTLNFADTSADQNGCKGATITLTLVSN